MNPPVASAATPDEERRALLSALVDGECDSARAGCDAWREHADARATWHSYHLIGDVLRSEDLAARPQRDEAFLAALRSRLADEPVVLAPAAAAAPAPAARSRRAQAWLMPAAVAAGFVAVAGVLVVARLSGPQADAPQLAVGAPAQPGLRLAGNEAPVAAALVIEGRFVRDAQLDAYLRAHREAMGGAPVALPGGAPRSIEILAPMTATSPVQPASAVR